MSSIVVRNLTKSFGAMRAVDDISFTVEEAQILVIVGASGCGKTTTLRCIAGLEQPTSGIIEIAGRTVVSPDVFVPPEQRGVGMMFQSYALWPHKSVFDNVAYGLVLRKKSTAEIKDATMRALSLVGLERMANRFPSSLSGGQQQRVALARSAVVEPKVLLLDEPLSNLDAKLREQMRIELRQLVKSLKMTAVHITHDQTEAMAIADKVIYMREGRIEQEGRPRELYNKPKSRSVAEFIGTSTFLDGVVTQSSVSNTRIVAINDTLRFTVAVPDQPSGTREVTIALRPECLTLETSRPEGDNVFPARIVSEIFLGDNTEYIVNVAGQSLKCRSRAEYHEGDSLFMKIDPEDIICLPRT